VANIPVVRMQMPPGPDESRFFAAILDALGLEAWRSDTVAARQDAAVRLMRKTGVRLLIIDELHNVLSGAGTQQRRLLNLLRWIGNELQIPLVGVGTAEALRAIRSDDQLVNRFEPFPLPPWTEDDAYLRLLSTLEAVLPLRRPSGLVRPALASRVFALSEGVLGEIVAVVTRAAARAVMQDVEAITPKLLNEAGFMRPSDRRRVAV
jgi:type II secretory pathway predicted ATPase ExeA